MLINIAISLIIIFSIVEFFIQKSENVKHKNIQYINSILILLFFIDTFNNFSQLINKFNFILCCCYFILLLRKYIVQINNKR